MMGLIQRYALGGALSAILMTVAWALLWHGPSQKQIGATEALIIADQVTKEVANELANTAEASRLRRTMCIDTGGVYKFGDGECQR